MSEWLKMDGREAASAPFPIWRSLLARLVCPIESRELLLLNGDQRDAESRCEVLGGTPGGDLTMVRSASNASNAPGDGVMDIDISSTALLVMDLQHDIVSPQGKFGSQGLGAAVEAAGTIGACARALGAARAAGMAVVHVGVEVRDGQALNTSAELFAGIAEAGALRAGSDGAAFMTEVAPRDGELVVMKSTVSAFAGTDLDVHLRNAGIRDLVLCGVATNFVVDGTARQAVDAGFRVSILTDGCSSFDPAWHETALQVLAMLASQATVDDFASAIG